MLAIFYSAVADFDETYVKSTKLQTVSVMTMAVSVIVLSEQWRKFLEEIHAKYIEASLDPSEGGPARAQAALLEYQGAMRNQESQTSLAQNVLKQGQLGLQQTQESRNALFGVAGAAKGYGQYSERQLVETY